MPGTVNYLKFYIPSILTGILFVLSIAPFDLWYLAYIAFIPLLYSSFNVSYHRVVVLYLSSALIISTGWWYSVISYSFITYCLITFVMSMSFVTWGVLSKFVRDRISGAFAYIFISTLIWVGLERIHTSELIGVPGNIGISQYAQPILIQSSSFFGIYAVSFLVLLTNALIAYLLLMLKKIVPVTRSSNIYIALAVAIMLLNILYGYSVLLNDKSDGLIKIAVVQPVISSSVYQNSWRNPSNRVFMKNTFDELTDSAVNEKVDIIFWPEGGNGYLNMRIPELRDDLYRIARDNKVNLLISSDDMDESGKKYNSIFSISSKGQLLGRYDKVKLIPDAESSYTAGQNHKPINTSFGPLGAAICYETNFPSIFRVLVDQGAKILFASTSDAAFKRTALVLSHTNLSVFRAIENRRWIVHASNTGPSIIVSPSGNVVKSSSLYKRQIITASISAVDEKSVFTRYGYLVAEIVALFDVILLVGLVYTLLVSNFIRKIYSKYSINSHMMLDKLYLYLPSVIIIGLLHAVLLVVTSVASVYLVNATVYDNTSLSVALIDYIKYQPPEEDIVSDRFFQANKNTCGPAVLAYLLSYYGKEVLESDLIPYMHLTEQGVSMLELKKVSNKLGFNAAGMKANLPGLKNQVLPIIAYINNSHYVVINRILDDFIYMFDPIEGHVKVSASDFRRMWSGYFMLLKMKPILES